jgi:hypothetical protein
MAHAEHGGGFPDFLVGLGRLVGVVELRDESSVATLRYPQLLERKRIVEM